MTGSPLTFISYRSLLRAGRYNRYIGLVLPGLAESHHTVHKGIKSMVLAHPDILTGIVNSSSLTDKNIAGLGHLTAEQLQSKSFAVFYEP